MLQRVEIAIKLFTNNCSANIRATASSKQDVGTHSSRSVRLSDNTLTMSTDSDGANGNDDADDYDGRDDDRRPPI